MPLKIGKVVATALALLAVTLVCSAANNPYGVHTFLQDAMYPALVDMHLTWARALTGPGGYVKQLIYPIGLATSHANANWKYFVQACYDRQLIPVMRLGSTSYSGYWDAAPADAPGDYHSIANVIKNIVNELPKNDTIPLYIEVWNEVNNDFEWSGRANPTEYAQFFVQTAAAIHSLGNPNVKVMNAALSPGGSYGNLAFVDAMCAVPGFVDSFDVWASHPYPSYPPERNQHDGTLSPGQFGIDSYLDELARIAAHGRTGVQVIITEGGYQGGAQDVRADLNMRAFRDYYSKWPEVLAVCPWEFCMPFGAGSSGEDWVQNSSTVNPDGTPTQAYPVYWAVHKLAKPGDSTGGISGKVTESAYGTALAGATCTLNPGGITTTTDTAGNYWFARLTPGSGYSITVSKTNYNGGSRTSLTVTAANNTVANFTLTATQNGTLTGLVKDSISGAGLAGVNIQLTPGSYSATTGSDGSYSISNLPPSSYSLQATKNGWYKYSTSGVAIGAGETTYLSFQLGPGPDPTGNYLYSSDLEGAGNVADGWISYSGGSDPALFGIDRGVTFSGVGSQRLTPGGSSDNYVWQMTGYSTVFTGYAYRLEVWAKASNPNGTVSADVRFFNNEIQQSGGFTAKPTLQTSNGWVLLVGRGVCPALPNGKMEGRAQIRLIAGLNSGTAWFDRAWFSGDSVGDTDPLSSATNLTATVSSGNIVLTWEHSSDSRTVGTRIYYRTDRYPLSVGDGTLLVNKTGSPGASASHTHVGSVLGTRYYYAAFSYNSGSTLVARPQFASARVTTDSTPPSTPAVSDQGSLTTTLNSLTAWWSSSDAETGVVEYQFALGTAQGACDAFPWTSVGGSVQQVMLTNLGLTYGKKYFFTVRAKNGAGMWSADGFSNGITPVQAILPLDQVKCQPDGTIVGVENVIVSAGTPQLTSAFYVQKPDRSHGIKVSKGTTSVSAAIGDRLSVAGKVGTYNNEKYLNEPAVELHESGLTVAPLAIRTDALGGVGWGAGCAVGITGAAGLHNLGLLVRTFGRVTYAYSTGKYFYLDDGARVYDGTSSGRYGIRVYYGEAAGSFTCPSAGDYVIVTGISGLRKIGSNYIRQLKPRQPADIVKLP